MMEPIKNLSIGDKFTETGLFAISDKIFTVEKFLNNRIIVAREDATGWGKAFDEDDMVFPCVRITQKR